MNTAQTAQTAQQTAQRTANTSAFDTFAANFGKHNPTYVSPNQRRMHDASVSIIGSEFERHMHPDFIACLKSFQLRINELAQNGLRPMIPAEVDLLLQWEHSHNKNIPFGIMELNHLDAISRIRSITNNFADIKPAIAEIVITSCISAYQRNNSSIFYSVAELPPIPTNEVAKKVAGIGGYEFKCATQKNDGIFIWRVGNTIHMFGHTVHGMMNMVNYIKHRISKCYYENFLRFVNTDNINPLCIQLGTNESYLRFLKSDVEGNARKMLLYRLCAAATPLLVPVGSMKHDANVRIEEKFTIQHSPWRMVKV